MDPLEGLDGLVGAGAASAMIPADLASSTGAHGAGAGAGAASSIYGPASGAGSGGGAGTNALELTQDVLNAIVDRLAQTALPSGVKFRPIPGGKQCAYMPADEIM